MNEVRSKTLTIQEWGIIIALLISSVTLIIFVYKEFLQNFKLNTSVDQIFIIRISGKNKQSLLIDMILDDLLSDTPSRQAKATISAEENLSKLASSGNRKQLKLDLIEYSKRSPITYTPPDLIIDAYLSDSRFSSSFYIPLIVYNSGRKFAHVTSLVMIAESQEDRSKKWAFAAFLEIDHKKILRRDKRQSDIDRISQIFSGFTIGPGETKRIDPWFTPMRSINKMIIPKENIKSGTYVIMIFGYDSKGKKVLIAEPVKFTIQKKNMMETFTGSESAHYLRLEENLRDALETDN
jgi:hypothetical protein